VLPLLLQGAGGRLTLLQFGADHFELAKTLANLGLA
jgi:hypothetical protein